MVWQYQTLDTNTIYDCVCMADKSGTPVQSTATPAATPVQNAPNPIASENSTGAYAERQAEPRTIEREQAHLEPRRTHESVYPESAHPYGQQKQPTGQQPGQYAGQSFAAPPPEKKPSTDSEGTLDDIKSSVLISNLAQAGKTGKLEVRGEESVGSIYFLRGEPVHATTPSAYGDDAIRDLVSWEKGTYDFAPNLTTEMRSVQGNLAEILSEGQALLDQKRHLKRAGLSFESLLLRKHKTLSETELRLMLMKGAEIDFEFQKKILRLLKTQANLHGLDARPSNGQQNMDRAFVQFYLLWID